MTDTRRVALITGGGRGIGRATALLLAERGWRVVAVSRTERDLADLAKGAFIDYIVASVETADGCERIVKETLARHGKVDVLVNNAGVDGGDEREIWCQDPALWRRSMAVHLDAAFHLTRLVTAGMVERRFGRVVMVASTAGSHGGAKLSAYCASKHGLLGLMRAAAQDLAPFDVTCNAVCPSWVRTPMSEGTAQAEATLRGVSTDQIWSERITDSPAGRIVTADEVARLIAFLAGPESSGVNAETITVSLGSVW